MPSPPMAIGLVFCKRQRDSPSEDLGQMPPTPQHRLPLQLKLPLQDQPAQRIASCACALYKEGRAPRQLCGGLLPLDLVPVRCIPGWGCQALPQRQRRRPCPCAPMCVSDPPRLEALQSWRPWPCDEQQISHCTLRRSWQCIMCRQRSWQLLCQGYSRHPGPPLWYQRHHLRTKST